MFKDFIDLSILKDAQPGFFSQSVETVCSDLMKYRLVPGEYVELNSLMGESFSWICAGAKQSE